MSLDYVLNGFWDEHADTEPPALGSYVPGGPWRPISAAALYLLVVLKIAPTFMRHRKPYELSSLILLFNSINIVANAFLFAAALIDTELGIKCFQCGKATPRAGLLLFGYYYLKFFDMLDTVFFVLRKKYNQVSTLHLVHHSLLPSIVWLGLKFYSSSPVVMLIILNTVAHMLMYSYYSATILALKPAFRAYSSKIILLKKYITIYQIVQFNILLAQIAIFLPKPCLTNFHRLLALTVGTFLLYMIKSFSAFYRKAYLTTDINGNDLNDNNLKKSKSIKAE